MSKIGCLQYAEVVRPRDTMNKRLSCNSLSWSTVEEADHVLKQGIGILAQKGLRARNQFDMERLKSPQGCMSKVRAYHAIAMFLERIPWSLRHFYVNRFSRVCKAYI